MWEMWESLRWQDWLGYAGAALMLFAQFLHAFAPRLDAWRLRALLALLGAAALLPAALLALRGPVFFLLVGWVLLAGYRLFRPAPRVS